MSQKSTEQTENCTFEPQLEQDNAEFTLIWHKLSHNQRRFVVAMRECSTKAEAAEAIGLTQSTVYRWPEIVDTAIAMMDRHVKDAAISVLADAVAKAALIKVGGLDSDDEAIRLATSSEVLDRVLGRATQAVKHEGTGDDGEIKVKQVGLTEEEEKAAMDAFYHRVLEEVRDRHSEGA